MIRLLILRSMVLFLLLAVFTLPLVALADQNTSSAAPLTLLQQPGKGPQTSPSQNSAQEDTALRDIQGPVPIIEQPPYLLLAGSILVLLAAAAALYWFMKKRTRPAPPPVPPWERALQDLAEAKRLLSPEQALFYMDRVSQILRSYIESRFAIKSTRQTTREFLDKLATSSNSASLLRYKSELQLCLEQADMAKFAHHTEDVVNLEKIGAAVVDFVQKTKPSEAQQRIIAGQQRPASQRVKRGGR